MGAFSFSGEGLDSGVGLSAVVVVEHFCRCRRCCRCCLLLRLVLVVIVGISNAHAASGSLNDYPSRL